jgi:3-phenylpropionate/cinnamic acid dioxygenase small subunit
VTGAPREKGEVVDTDGEVRYEDVRLLVEERSILRLLHRYAHAMDMGREAEWVDTFTPDAVFDVVEVVGGRRVHREEGRGDLAAYVAGYPKPPQFRKHIVTDPIIEIDGNVALVEAYWLLLQRDDAVGMPVLAAFGHYHDRLVKTDGGWRIAERNAEVQASATPVGGETP